MLQISSAKVAHIILLAKKNEAMVAPWDDTQELGDAAEEPESILEDFADETENSELATFIADLNVDEQTSLVALAWIGRGTYTVDQFDEAVETATVERITPTETYLMGLPLLSDYLAEGLEVMGASAIDAEEDLLGVEEQQDAPER